MKKQFTRLIGVFSALVFLITLTAIDAQSQAYVCPPDGEAGAAESTADEYIYGISFQSFVNNTGAPDDEVDSEGNPTGNGLNVVIDENGENEAPQITDFTSLGSIGTIEAGTTDSITVEIGDAFTSDNVYVYVDLNQDEQFTDDELVGSNLDGPYEDTDGDGFPDTPDPKPATASLKVGIDVPLNAFAGETQIRVKLAFGASADVCDNPTWGETEDYRITIQEGVCFPPVFEVYAENNCPEGDGYNLFLLVDTIGGSGALNIQFTSDDPGTSGLLPQIPVSLDATSEGVPTPISLGTLPYGTNVEWFASIGELNSPCNSEDSLLTDREDLIPCNDSPCNAYDLVLGGDTLFGNNESATVDEGEPVPPEGSEGCESEDGWCPGDDELIATTWYTFTGPTEDLTDGTGRVRISTCTEETLDDTQLAVYEVNDCGDFSTYTLVGANDNGGSDCGVSSNRAILEICTTPGTLYYVQVDANETFDTNNYGIFVEQIDEAICFCDQPIVSEGKVCLEDSWSPQITIETFGSATEYSLAYGSDLTDTVPFVDGVATVQGIGFGVTFTYEVVGNDSNCDSDDNPSGSYSITAEDCLPDCEGVAGGSALYTQPCEVDGVPGAWDINCNCVPSPLEACDNPDYSSSPGLPIGPDFNTDTRDTITIDLENSAVLLDLDIILDFSHDDFDDVEVYLQAPNGEEFSLFTDICGGFPAPGGRAIIRLNDGADLPINEACNPDFPELLYGEFQTEDGIGGNDLSEFNGFQFEGDWVLRIRDDAGGDAGILNSWCLKPLLQTEICETPDVELVAVDALGNALPDECMERGMPVFYQATVSGGTLNTEFEIFLNDEDADTVAIDTPTILSPEFETGEIVEAITIGIQNEFCADTTVAPATVVCPLDNGCGEYSSSPNLGLNPNDGFSGDGVRDTITIDGFGPTFLLTDLDVAVRINHPNMAEIDVFLEGPNGVEIDLWEDDCSGGQNADVVLDDDFEFDDESDPSIDDNCESNLVPTLYGFYQTEDFGGELEDFDLISPNGSWVLRVRDDSNEDNVGTLVQWCLLPDPVDANCTRPDTLIANYLDLDGVLADSCEAINEELQLQVEIQGGSGNANYNVVVGEDTVLVPANTPTIVPGSYFAGAADLELFAFGAEAELCQISNEVEAPVICPVLDLCDGFTSSPDLFLGIGGDESVDGSRDTIAVSAPEGEVILDLNVILDYEHTSNDELVFFLEGPQGQEVRLFGEQCSFNDDGLLYLDDQSPNSIESACNSGTNPDLEGFARTESGFALSSFNTTNPNGNWVLRVFDNEQGTFFDNTGNLNSWCLIFETSADTPCEPPIVEADFVNAEGNPIGDCGSVLEQNFTRVSLSGGSGNSTYTVIIEGLDTAQVAAGDTYISPVEVPLNSNLQVSALGNDEPICIGSTTANLVQCDLFDECGTFTSSPAADITNTQVNDPIEVSGYAEDEVITDLTVVLDITHEWNEDMNVSLVSPLGVVRPLFTGICGSDENVLVILNDNLTENGPIGSTESCLGTGPTAGAYTTETGFSLSSSVGSSPNGTWTLRIDDTFPAFDDGVLNSWCLIPEVGVPTCESPEISLNFLASDSTQIEAGCVAPDSSIVVEATVVGGSVNTEFLIGFVGGAQDTVELGVPFILPGVVEAGESFVIRASGVEDPLCPTILEAVGPYCSFADSCGGFTSAPNKILPELPDPIGEGVRDTITVSGQDGQVLDDLDVAIVLRHGDVSELDVFLEGPNGLEIQLFADECFGGQDVDVLFDDDGDEFDCTSGQRPVVYGNYQLDSPDSLASFNNILFDGDWVLRIRNDAGFGNSGGVLNSWCLIPTLTPQTCDAPEADVVLTNTSGTVLDGCVIPGNLVQANLTLSGGSGNTQFVVFANGQGPDTLNIDEAATLSPNFDSGEDIFLQVQGTTDPTCQTTFTVPGVELCTQTDNCGEFSSSPAKAIGPDADLPGEGVRDTITVSGFGSGQVIADLNMVLKIDHDALSNLDVYLTSPNGIEYTLFEDQCAFNNDMDVLLDDQASPAINLSDGCASGIEPALFGAFRTNNNNLGQFIGSPVDGEWILRVHDDANSNAGELIQWCLLPTPQAQTCDPASIDLQLTDADGLVFPADICLDPGTPIFVAATITGGTENTSFEVIIDGGDPDTLQAGETVVLSPEFALGDSLITVSAFGQQDETCPATASIVNNIAQCTNTDLCTGNTSSPGLDILSPSFPEPSVTVTDTIVVPDNIDPNLSIADLNVVLDITHSWLTDVDIVLEKVESGTEAIIFQTGVGFTCSSEENMDVVIDDESENVLECADGVIPTLFGDYQPEVDPLSVFDGEDFSGTWVLRVSDNVGGDDGVLNQWCLIDSLAEFGDINGTISDLPEACSPIDGVARVYEAGTANLVTSIDFSVTIDEVTGEGSFDLGAVQAGDYDVYVKLDRYLRVVQENVSVTADGVELSFADLIQGDLAVSASEVIDIEDLQQLLDVVGQPDLYTEARDLDCNGIIDIEDLQIVLDNVGVSQGAILPEDE